MTLTITLHNSTITITNANSESFEEIQEVLENYHKRWFRGRKVHVLNIQTREGKHTMVLVKEITTVSITKEPEKNHI